MAVFLNYLMSNSDPSPVFFYLVTESYQQGSMKDLRRWAFEIYSTFLIKDSPLKVKVDDHIVSTVDQNLTEKFEKEDIMKTIFHYPRHVVQSEISQLLTDYRYKKTLGLANMYGDHELSDDMEKAQEHRV